MKITNTVFTAAMVLGIAACSAIKKNSRSTATTAPASKSTSPTTPSNIPVSPLPFAKPSDGIYAPGNEEVNAIAAQHKGATLNQLTEGYTIYTQGACIGCHKAQAIYQFQETEWKDIVDDMAQKAKISEAQKDAVYKYVVSIKATQPK